MERITLRTEKVSIEFPGVKALQNVDFSVSTGDVLALVGANGAGKSTLMKVFAGANPTYTGDVYVGDKKVEIRTPSGAKALGIQIVYQEVDTALYPTLSVAENIIQNDMIMGRTKTFVNWKNVYKEGRAALDKLNIPRSQIDERKMVSELTLAQKQMVLIAKAVKNECSFLILDEPTAPLSNTETKELFDLVKHLHATENIAIIFISHRLNEVLEICQKYSVMRNGMLIDSSNITKETSTKEIVEKMLGRNFNESFERQHSKKGQVLFSVKGLCGAEGMVNNVDLYVREGEILGIAGLVGAGKSELCKTLFGALKADAGEIRLRDRVLKLKNPSGAVKERIALVPEERRKEGVLVNETVSFNLSAASMDKFCSFSFINRKKVDENARGYVKSLGVSTPSVHQLVRNLSGGNQQKVAVGKWLSADCDVYIFDEPTKGVDVGAKQDIFHLISKIAHSGKAVIYATCENSELLSLTDRMYVMYSGKIMAELETAKTNEDEIMFYSVGGQEKEAVG